jgi:predicted dehydrogenase
MDRRSFLKAGAALALSGPGVLDARPAFAAGIQEGMRVGLIGCGWYGKTDLFRLIQVAPVEVVSLCDVDANLLSGAAAMVAERQRSKQRPRTYSDYREMLGQRNLDVVLVVTPDHWHALPAIAALQAGADVWVQKPISVDIVEGQAMVAAARKYERVVQVGTQRRSTAHIAEARELLRSGRLGKVGLVEAYSYYHMRTRDNPPDSPPPPHLDWEMWTGPAPMRPYNRLIHPRGWRAFQEYGNGILGDMCIHMLDMARWMLDLGWPRSVASTGGILVDTQSKSNVPDTQTATFAFEDVNVVWQHRTWGHPADPDYPWGATFYGARGTLKVSVHGYDFIPLGQGEEPIHREVRMELDEYPEDRTEQDLERHVAPAIRAHFQDFLSAIRSRGRPVSDIEEGHISTASCILANHALALRRTLHWDAAAQRVIDDEEANTLLARPYRAPWVHPTPDSV